MARNRMIKPEFWSSETLNRVSLEANLLFIGLWNFADDYGVLLDNSRKILGDVFPLRESTTRQDVEKWISELIDIKVIIPVEHNNKKLLIIKSWFEHQKVANPSKRSHLDNPTQEEINRLISDYLESNEGLNRPKVSKEKEKEKEKDKEKDILSSKPDKKEVDPQVKEVVEYLNHKTGKNYSPKAAHTKHISARLKEGYSIAELKRVIDVKVKEWLGGQYAKYLRPQTLFNTEKFDQYLNQEGICEPNKLAPNKDYNLEDWRTPLEGV